jgi:quinol monooxygenase YgiN
MNVYLFATVFPKPEYRDAVEQELRLMVEHSRQEPGNLTYDLFVRAGEPLAFDLFERYQDQAAVDAHRQSAHFQAYRAKVENWLAAPVQVHASHALDVAQ